VSDEASTRRRPITARHVALPRAMHRSSDAPQRMLTAPPRESTKDPHANPCRPPTRTPRAHPMTPFTTTCRLLVPSDLGAGLKCPCDRMSAVTAARSTTASTHHRKHPERRRNTRSSHGRVADGPP
jgi:hypothetical protein